MYIDNFKIDNEKTTLTNRNTNLVNCGFLIKVIKRGPNVKNINAKNISILTSKIKTRQN